MESREILVAEQKASKTSNKTGDLKWDKYLDDYCNYFKEYKKHYKKSNEGNMNSLSLYPYMQQKWQFFKKQISRAYKYNRLNDQQIERLMNMKTIEGC
ncbi:hypothetical protein MW871_13330 [Flavobacterium sp. I-SCBP12n]|uniref:Uncharacterized protein n=2 Tax=Flavobacterium TaxID=237 RepID=A0A9X1XTD4_9FLAO|nr:MULTISPECIES: hypothetical protein [Flavobacterium]MBP4142844.1 hypothetical protein [Flavobacterium flabelliforme]MCK8142877.1 hypothetical protein [Flavobacterium pygoscelis]